MEDKEAQHIKDQGDTDTFDLSHIKQRKKNEIKQSEKGQKCKHYFFSF